MSSSPQMIYTLVIRGVTTVLSEYSTAGGNFIQFAKTVCTKVNSVSAKKSFNYDQYEFHILVENNYGFLVMAEKGFKMRIAFALLEDLKQRFFQKFSQKERDEALQYGLNDAFSPIQKEKLIHFNSPDADAISKIKQNVEQTKEIMMENLDKLLERGEKIDILVQKTALMVDISTDMKKNATTLHRQMYWKNKKMAIIICLITSLSVYFLLSFICGFTFKKCS